MDAWAEELVSMMTSSGPLLLRSCVKKEEDLVLQAGSPSNSSLYSPTTTGLHFELELSQGDVVGSGAGLGSYGPQSPTLSRSLSRSLSSPEPDMEREAAERQYCSSTTAALGSAFRHAKVDLSQEVGSGTGLTRSYDATSPALSRSLSRSLSSPEPDADRDGDRQYCSSTTASAVRDYHHNHRSHADGSKGDDDSPKRLCLVCGDVASGFHYGVASCEACKAFFKRTIQGNIEYTCPASNDCEINKRRRKACQACRFQKCIRMGMLKEGVRLDRVRGGRQKYRRTAPYPVEITTKKYLTIEDNVMVSTLSSCEPDLVFNVADGAWAEELATAEADTGLRVIAMLSDLYDRELVATIGWAKQIPGFSDLSLNDQMRLLQSAWPEVLSLSLAYRSMSSPGKLNFASDFSLDERQAKECGLEEFYALCIQVVDRFSRLNINKEEYFIMKALVLANADVRVENFAALKKLRDNLMTALAEIVNILRPNMSVTNLQSILLCLPCIRQVDMCIRRFWTSVRRESRVHMNKLFVEMLDAHLR